ncbi:DUF3558 domain-containing protein [Actinokineospora sp.]|uniref:DUF3558 domain-containing protein n=1 Tax=Actinokineospora sp. TaxID=1872133 RepID=UPI003D6BE0FC
MRSRILLAGACAVLLGISACTTSEAGSPTTTPTGQEGSATSKPTSTKSASPTVEIPARPKEFKLDAVDPCALFTEAQRGQLKINRSRLTTNNSDIWRGSKECVLNVQAQQPYYDYSALLITSEGIGPWLTGKRNVDADLISVAGFAAAKTVFKGASNERNSQECAVSVDVAEGQQLMVSMSLTSRNAFTQDQICQMTEQAAGMAVTTLQTLA